jgi:CMP-N-acetylneuraminic acid synthetase
MKTVVMIPYWNEYRFPDRSIKNRDTLKVGGQSLIERAVSVVQGIKLIDEVVIFSSDEQVKEFLDSSLKFTFQKRDLELDDECVSIEDIIDSFLKTSNADIIVLMHPKCPFLRSESIAECVNSVFNGSFDSAFIGSKNRKLAWFNGKPLNFTLERGEGTKSLSSIEPVIFESSSVYVFTRELFNNTRRRVSLNPYIKFVGHFEGFEIDRHEDFEVAELIFNAGLDGCDS